MYRRVNAYASIKTTVVVSSQLRLISEYNFGQTSLSKPWSSSSYYPKVYDNVNITTDSKVKVSQLHNGTRVITQQRDGVMVSIGAYILAGPVYDPVSCPGVHHLLHLALTTSNYNNSLFQLDRSIRSTGAAFSHFEKDKHYACLRLDCRMDMWTGNNNKNNNNNNNKNMMITKGNDTKFSLNLVQDTIFTAIAAPRFHETDIERFRDTIDNNLKELRWQYPTRYAIEKLETVAFYKEPLGNPRHVPENNNENITSKILLNQYAQYVTPDRVVISGVNVDHDELIAEYENTPYSHSNTAPHHAAFKKQNKTMTNSPTLTNEQLQYTSGEAHEHENRPKEMCTKPDMDTETIVAVGYLSFGRGRTSIKQYAATLVFQQLMNMSLQEGIRGALTESNEGVHSFYMPYQTAGLIGFTARSEPENIVKMVTSTMREIQNIKLDNNSAVETAKHCAAVEFRSRHLDTVRDLCDYMGINLPLVSMSQDSTQYTSPEEILNAIQSVTPAALKQVKDCAISSKPSLFGHGEMLAFPSLRQLGF